MAWFFLLCAGVFEIFWASSLKMTEGFSRLWPSVMNVCLAVASFYFLSKSIQTLPIGTAYAVWTGMGAVGVAVIGIIYYGDPATPLRLICLGLIVLGIIGLKLAHV